MKKKYVPIMKCKMGEQKALEKLEEEVKDSIIPLLEIPHSESVTKKSVSGMIESFWNDRKFFFYFMPEWYESNVEAFPQFLQEEIVPLCNTDYGIPVIDLSLVDGIDNWNAISKNGIAIRLRNNEFADIEEVLNTLFKSNGINRNCVDLILDLQYVSENDLFAKTSVLKAVFSDLDAASEYRSIIISSVSFPKTLSNLEVGKIYRFRRMENEIFKLSLKLAERFKFNYCYSDYGPTDIGDVSFVLGMSPNFKIKYTAIEDFLCIKGLSLKKGGLDITNVYKLAKILVESSDFSGEEYSWGDNEIYRLAQKLSNSPGNLTTWVSYAMNHHITLITRQI